MVRSFPEAVADINDYLIISPFPNKPTDIVTSRVPRFTPVQLNLITNTLEGYGTPTDQ